jgi:hypothetical protein
MRPSPLLRSFLYIAFFLSVVRAFNVTVGAPTQCDDLAVSWTGKRIYNTCSELLLKFTMIAGGQAPFEIILVPVRRHDLSSYQLHSNRLPSGL